MSVCVCAYVCVCVRVRVCVRVCVRVHMFLGWREMWGGAELARMRTHGSSFMRVCIRACVYSCDFCFGVAPAVEYVQVLV